MTSKEEEYINGSDLWKYNKMFSSHAVVWAENVIKFIKIKISSLSENVQSSNFWHRLSSEYLTPDNYDNKYFFINAFICHQHQQGISN